MCKAIDLTGNTFNRLTVISYSHKDKYYKKFWNAMCECGKIIKVDGSHLKEGHTKSCGCLDIERFSERTTTHNMSRTPIYKIWASMVQRCTNVNNKSYYNYGGRGITVSDEWLKFECFYEDMGDRPKNLSIDRKDNNKGYSKENCKWSTRIEQNNNMRSNINITYNNKTQSLTQWAKELGISKDTLYNRIVKYKWSARKALGTLN